MRTTPGTISLRAVPLLRRRAGQALVVVGAAAGVLLLGWVAVRPALVNLGSTAVERQAVMPGDGIVPEALLH